MTSDGKEPSGTERERLRCFVIGPIGNQFGEVGSEARQRYEDAIEVVAEVIEPACATVGLSPIRADGLARVGEITEQVFRRLRDDDVVIADLTDANANVMYELGMRHTRNRLTVQIGEYDRLPFDINVIRTVQFIRSPHGLVKARQELVRMLEAGLAGKFDLVTATRVWSQIEHSEADIDLPHPSKDREDQSDVPGSPGLMELIGEALQYQSAIQNATNAISERMAEITCATDDATEQMSQNDTHDGGMSGRLAALARYARDVDSIAERLERNVSDYESAVISASTSILTIIERLEEDPSQLPEAIEFGQLIRRLAGLARDCLGSQQLFTTRMNDAARMSKAMRQPVHRLVTILDRFAAVTQLLDESDRRLQVLGVPVPP